MSGSERAFFMEGKWAGEGHVLLNFMAPVQYKEETEFKVIRTEPVLVINIQQYTKHAETGAPMHAENGFFKIFPGPSDRKVEAMYSHPFSLNEFEFGTFNPVDAETGGPKMVLEANEEKHFQRAAVPTDDVSKAKLVTGLRREYFLDKDGKLNYNVYLAVGQGGQPLKHHLVCKLSRVE